jgi:hypothetical protein
MAEDTNQDPEELESRDYSPNALYQRMTERMLRDLEELIEQERGEKTEEGSRRRSDPSRDGGGERGTR